MKKIDDKEIITEAIRLVEEGVFVTFPVNGRSMLPFIIGGKDKVILEKAPQDLKAGDIVLAEIEPFHFVIHRIIKINNENIILMGDGNLAQKEHCTKKNIKAKISCIIKANGKKHFTESFFHRFLAKIWVSVLPFRKWLLAFYRRIFL